jgi:hypothetical protein
MVAKSAESALLRNLSVSLVERMAKPMATLHAAKNASIKSFKEGKEHPSQGYECLVPLLGVRYASSVESKSPLRHFSDPSRPHSAILLDVKSA